MLSTSIYLLPAFCFLAERVSGERAWGKTSDGIFLLLFYKNVCIAFNLRGCLFSSTCLTNSISYMSYLHASYY